MKLLGIVSFQMERNIPCYLLHYMKNESRVCRSSFCALSMGLGIGLWFLLFLVYIWFSPSWRIFCWVGGFSRLLPLWGLVGLERRNRRIFQGIKVLKIKRFILRSQWVYSLLNRHSGAFFVLEANVACSRFQSFLYVSLVLISYSQYNWVGPLQHLIFLSY